MLSINCYKTHLNFGFLLLFLSSLLFLNSCIVVKDKEEINNGTLNVGKEYTLTTKAPLPVSDTYIRSQSGDMIALLPEGWILLNADNNTNPDIFAIAVNKEYSMSAVFSQIRKTSNLEQSFSESGLVGVVNYDIGKKKLKTSESLNIFGDIDIINIGIYQFSKFRTTKNSGITYSQSAIFRSSLNNFYEFSIVPLSLNGNSFPEPRLLDDTFLTILTTIKH